MINYQDPHDINSHKSLFDRIYRCFMVRGYRIHKMNNDEICEDCLSGMSSHRSFGYETFYHVGDNYFIFTDPVPLEHDDEDGIEEEEIKESPYEKSMKTFMETVDRVGATKQ